MTSAKNFAVSFDSNVAALRFSLRSLRPRNSVGMTDGWRRAKGKEVSNPNALDKIIAVDLRLGEASHARAFVAAVPGDGSRAISGCESRAVPSCNSRAVASRDSRAASSCGSCSLLLAVEFPACATR